MSVRTAARLTTRLAGLLAVALLSFTAVITTSNGSITASPASPATSPDASPVISADVKPVASYTPAELETQIIALTNQRRAAAGCNSVMANSYIRLAARRHSNLMGKNQTMSHQLSGEPTLGRRITLAGYTNWTRVGENIAAGFGSASQVMNAWMNSDTHRRNILDCSFRHIGVGVVYLNGRYWWTQDFGRK